MKQKRNLTTAEFARLCGTTKDTLFLYDRRGILTPAEIGENGYRYYVPYQHFDYQLIHMLKQTGSTLSEIHECLQEQDVPFFDNLFEEQIHRCDEQIRELQQMRQHAANLQALLRYAAEQPIGQPELVELPAQRIFTTIVPSGDSWENGPPKSYLQHLQRCDAHPLLDAQPLGTLYHTADFSKPDGSFLADLAYFAAAPAELESEHIQIKPAGQYLRIFCKGWETMVQGIEQLLEYASTHGYQLGTYTYEYDLVTFIRSKQSSIIIEVQIQVLNPPSV